ncbi:MAG TPA: DUF2807 domain-containing protein [Ohtaekwangia sp.]
MKKPYFVPILVGAVLIAIISLLLTSCGESEDPEKTYQFIGFDGVHVDPDLDIFIQQGDEFAVSASGDPANLKILHVGITDQNNILFRYIDPHKRYPRTQIRITMPTIHELSVSDYSTAEMVGFLSDEIETLTMYIRSGSSVVTDGVVDSLYARLLGAAKLTLTGSGRALKVYANGNSRVEAFSFYATKANIDITDYSQVYIHATEKLDAKVSVSSTVFYTGEPEITSEVDDSSVFELIP